MGNSQGNIDALVDKVDRPVQQEQSDRNGRIGVHEGVQNRTQDVLTCRNGSRYGQRPARSRSLTRSDEIGFVEIGYDAAAYDRVSFARFAQLERTRRAMKQRNTNMSFKKSKRATYRSRRSPQLAPCLSQATLVEGGDEDLHGVDSVHFPTV